MVDDMVSLIQTCGGEIVPSVDQLKPGEKTSLIVTCSEVEDDDGDVQLSSQDVARFNSRFTILILEFHVTQNVLG